VSACGGLAVVDWHSQSLQIMVELPLTDPHRIRHLLTWSIMLNFKPEATEQGIIDFVAEMAKAKLEDNSVYLINHISPDLRKHGIDYKAIIEPLKLRDFLVLRAADKVRVVIHPNVRARIAVVPKDSEFQFVEEPAKPEVNTSRPQRGGNERAVVDFIKALSTLSDSELGDFSIPAKILARLYKK